jgi:predicted ATPase
MYCNAAIGARMMSMFARIPQWVIYIGLPLIGVFVGWGLSRFLKRRELLRTLRAAVEARKRAFETLRESIPTPSFLGSPATLSFAVEKISITNFKNIEQLTLDLVKGSSLEGKWSCIAGINGAGKSAILQALCIVLLGEKYAAELGSNRLRRMIRRTPDGSLESAKIEAWLRRSDDSLTRIALPLNKEGVDELALRSESDYSKMRQFWEEMKSTLLVSYGAARNLTQEEEKKHESQAKRVQQQMTLFDPLTRIADVDVLVKAGPGNEKKRRTLQRLLEQILDKEELRVWSEGDRLTFGRTGTRVDAIDLPDGFRSTVAWLSDLCSAWHDSAPDGFERETDPSLITGIVLLDEIDLHLHPNMARSIVPRLRRVLPRVQFVVTTHSPLVLGSFDRNELIVLEADEQGLVNARTLDRQVFGFSMDEIYKWLMRTPPHSTVLEEKVASGDDPNFASYLYQSPALSSAHEGVSAADSELLVNDLERLLKDVKSKT